MRGIFAPLLKDFGPAMSENLDKRRVLEAWLRRSPTNPDALTESMVRRRQQRVTLPVTAAKDEYGDAQIQGPYAVLR